MGRNGPRLCEKTQKSGILVRGSIEDEIQRPGNSWTLLTATPTVKTVTMPSPRAMESQIATMSLGWGAWNASIRASAPTALTTTGRVNVR